RRCWLRAEAPCQEYCGRYESNRPTALHYCLTLLRLSPSQTCTSDATLPNGGACRNGYSGLLPMFGLTPPGLLVRGRFPVNTRHFVEDCWPYVAQAAARESPPGARVPSRLSVPAT